MADPENAGGGGLNNDLERPPHGRVWRAPIMTELHGALAGAAPPAASLAQNDTGARVAAERAFGWFALAVPALTLVAFIASYATAMPVTDDWFFLRAAVA